MLFDLQYKIKGLFETMTILHIDSNCPKYVSSGLGMNRKYSQYNKSFAKKTPATSISKLPFVQQQKSQ